MNYTPLVIYSAALGLIILSIFYPPVLIIIALIAVYPISLIIVHKTGGFVPHWTFECKEDDIVIHLYYISKTENATGVAVYPESSGGERRTVYFDESDPVSYLGEKKCDGLHHHYTINLSRLPKSPDGRYRYFIYRKDADGKPGSVLFDGKYCRFSTEGLCGIRSDAELPFRFAVFGDMQIAESLEIIESYLVYLIRKNGPELLISLGDNWHKWYIREDMRVYHRILRKIVPSVPFYTVPGNHDYGEDEGRSLALEAMMLPVTGTGRWYYSFIFKNVYFIALNSECMNDPVKNDSQLKWLEKELEKASKLRNDGKIDWIITFQHRPWWGPPYDPRSGDLSFENFLLETYVPLFRKFGVDLHFAGHKHSYCRCGNAIITGSMHGVRNYPEQSEKDYFLRNSHQFCTVEVGKDVLTVYSKTWFNRNLDIYRIYRGDRR